MRMRPQDQRVRLASNESQATSVKPGILCFSANFARHSYCSLGESLGLSGTGYGCLLRAQILSDTTVALRRVFNS